MEKENEEYTYFNGMQSNRTYISKRIENKNLDESISSIRYVNKVIDSKEIYGEIKKQNEVILRITPSEREKITAKVLEKDHKIFVLTIQKYTIKTGNPHKTYFSFVGEEIKKLKDFIDSIVLLSFDNFEKSRVEDDDLLKMRNDILKNPDLIKLFIENGITDKDVVSLGYRKNQLEIFSKLLNENYLEKYRQSESEKYKNDKNPRIKINSTEEKVWQYFFENNEWIFGYGLDYRFMTIFDREMTVGDGGTQNQDKPTTDFLNEFNDFTVLVELKTSNTELFDKSKNRSGSFKLSDKLIDAFSQVLEQKAEWQIKGDRSGNTNKEGNKKLEKRTRDPKMILVIGNKEKQILNIENINEKNIKMDTFELFRRDSRNVEIITYDELYERAYFIVNEKTR